MELGGFGGGECKAKGRSSRGTGQHRAAWPPLPVQRPPSENGHEAQAPPAPTKTVALPTGPSGVGFWWKRGEWREEQVRAPSSQASAQGPPPVSLRGGAAVWRQAVPSAHPGCANRQPGLGPWGPRVAAGTPPHGVALSVLSAPCPLPFHLSPGLLLLRWLRRILR